MILFRDYSNSKKSLTVTGLVLSFLLCVASIIGNIVALLLNERVETSIIWAALCLYLPFVGLYWNKRFHLSADSKGIKLSSQISAKKRRSRKVKDPSILTD